MELSGKTYFVNREFKRTMDSYEGMMDAYIQAMKSGDSMKILSAMTQYTQALEALDEVDEDELSDADMAYYLAVTARVSQKLLAVQ